MSCAHAVVLLWTLKWGLGHVANGNSRTRKSLNGQLLQRKRINMKKG